jgi:predicted secreted hydrolase
LRRAGEDWLARLPAADFALDLRCRPTQPLLLQGREGLSRKGPDAAQASYYYSMPHLAVDGTLALGKARMRVQGKAWLDHEWSEALMHPEAVGWDWIGMNLDDGSALTAFRLRRKDGSTLWDGGSFRSAKGDLYVASPGETQFSAQRRWTSPRSAATYPVEWIVRTPADFFTVRAVLDDQELDSRASTGAIYWEGLSDLIDSNGRRVGRGYLEMTGYARRLRI